MKTRLLGISAAAAVAIALTAAPATAQEGATVTYAASADARALHLSLFGNDLTLGSSHAELASAPSASGTGIGLVSPVQNVSEVSGTVTADGTNAGSKDETCSPLSLPEVPVLTIETACGSGFAEIVDGNPASLATGRVGTIGVAPDDVLNQTPIPDAVNQVVNEVITNLGPLFDGLDDALNSDLDATIEDLVDALIGEDADTLVRADIGSSTSSTNVVDSALVATASAEGAVIDVLDRGDALDDLGVELGPVLRIVVGSATSTVDVDLDAATATGTFEPALVRIVIAPDVLSGLPAALVDALPLEGAQSNEIVVPVGQTVCVLPAPLESCITAADGEVTANDDGSVSVTTSAVRLDLLTGVEGGVTLALADTAATGGAIAIPPTTTTTAPPVTVTELPRTGGMPFGNSGVVFATGIFAALGLAVTKRARLTQP